MIATIKPDNCKKTLLTSEANQYITEIANSSPIQKNPICIINIGGIASGKTTVCRIYIKDYLKMNMTSFCDINPDNVLEKFYDNNVNCYGLTSNSPYDIINGLFTKAVSRRCNILYDTTGINTKDVMKKLKELHKHKYIINFCVCVIDNIDIALKRVIKRAKKTGRHVDEDHFIQRYHDLPIALNTFYFKLPKNKYNEIVVFNTSRKTPKLIHIF